MRKIALFLFFVTFFAMLELESAFAQQQPLVTATKAVLTATGYGPAPAFVSTSTGNYWMDMDGNLRSDIPTAPSVIATTKDLAGMQTHSLSYDGQGKFYAAMTQQTGGSYAPPSILAPTTILWNDGTGLKTLLSPNQIIPGTGDIFLLCLLPSSQTSAGMGKFAMIALTAPNLASKSLTTFWMFDGVQWMKVLDLATTKLFDRVGMCASDGSMKFMASATSTSGPDSVWKVGIDGVLKQITAPRSSEALTQIACVEAGLLTRYTLGNGLKFGFIPNGSDQEQVLVAGTDIAGFAIQRVNTIAITANPASPWYFTTADGDLVKMTPNQDGSTTPKVLKGKNESPMGFGYVQLGIGGRPWYSLVDAKRNITSFLVFDPMSAPTSYTVGAGSNLVLPDDVLIPGIQNTLTLNGQVMTANEDGSYPISMGASGTMIGSLDIGGLFQISVTVSVTPFVQEEYVTYSENGKKYLFVLALRQTVVPDGSSMIPIPVSSPYSILTGDEAILISFGEPISSAEVSANGISHIAATIERQKLANLIKFTVPPVSFLQEVRLTVISQDGRSSRTDSFTVQGWPEVQ